MDVLGTMKRGSDGLDAFAGDIVSLPFIVDGGGVAIAVGSKVDIVDFPFAGNIVGWTMITDASATADCTVSKCTYANYPTFSSVSGTEKPAVAAAQKGQDLSLTTWTQAVAQGDILRLNVDSNDNAKRITVVLRIKRT